MSLANLLDPDPRSDSWTALFRLDQAALDALPAAVYLCAADGRIVRFNRRAADVWGRTPSLGESGERFCGSFRLYRTDGTLLPHDLCPMASALQTGESFHGQEVVIEQPNGERRTVLVSIAAVRNEQGHLNGAVNCFQDITDRKRTEERQHHLIQELNHRVRNTLATVHSLVANTARNASSLDDFKSRFEARLLALSLAQTLLGEDRWAGAGLHEVLAQQLEPFGGMESPRVQVEGPEVALEARLALDLSMMFHELMTNAAKYGAMSGSSGKISVNWEVLPPCGGDRVLELRWTETDGPPVRPPRRTGFGTRLIKAIAKGLGGDGHLVFDPSGLQLRATIPLRVGSGKEAKEGA